MAKKIFTEPKIISFFCEKGGSGKSLLTNVIANEIIFHYALKGQKINVCVLELDSQRTLGVRRAKNLDSLKFDLLSDEFQELDSDSQKEIRQLQRSYLALQQKFNFMSYTLKSINTASPKECKNTIDWMMSNDFDIILLDFPGTLQQEGTADFFLLLTHLFIPIVARQSEADGIVAFLQRVNIPSSIQTHFILNQADTQYESAQNDVCEAFCNTYAYPILKNSMKKTVFFETDTILPTSVNVNQKTLEIKTFPITKCAADVATEIIKIIKN